LRIHTADKRIDYDGSQLRSHFATRTFGVSGDSVVVFKGGMDIPSCNIADLEDLLQGDTIRGDGLIHFIAEHFGITLETAVLRQRLLVRLAAGIVRELSGKEPVVAGDDIFVAGGKLSVSIAAPSPVSCLIHLGINLTTGGVPVKAAALDDLGVDADRFATDLTAAYSRELESITRALSKVRGVQ
jgi:uncharacterized protein